MPFSGREAPRNGASFSKIWVLGNPKANAATRNGENNLEATQRFGQIVPRPGSTMTDVFISYKDERRPHAFRLAVILQAYGYEVWWAKRMKPAASFDRQIQSSLKAAKAVVVLWCSGSCESRYVWHEANEGITANKLIQCKIEKQCVVPIGMQRDQYEDLSDWNGSINDDALENVLDVVEQMVQRPRRANRELIQALRDNLKALDPVLPIPKAAEKACGDDATAAADLDAEAFKLLSTTSDFEGYVLSYPSGAFVAQAQEKLRQLDTAWVAELQISQDDWRLGTRRMILDKLGNTASRADLEPRAVRGSAEAATLLGLQGEVAGDAARASDLYAQAAHQGFARAQLLYADALAAKGLESHDECMRWAKASADQDNPWGQNLVGVNYQKGRGVAKDYTQAASWYRKAADQGLGAAQGNLAYLLRCGFGLRQNQATALEWYRKGAAQGDIESQFGLGDMLSKREGVAKEDTHAALVEAAKWFSRAAEAGEYHSQARLARMLEIGEGVAKNEKDAFVWCLKAAEQGYPVAECKVGEMLEHGIGVKANLEEAIEWYRKAAQQGHAEAEKALARLA